MAQQVWLNEQLVPVDQAKVSVFDHGLLYGDGVFEGIRIYNRRIFKCATHLKRLDDSARAIRLQLPYTAAQLTEAMRQTMAANEVDNGYIRLCVTRGIGTLGINPLTCERPTVFIIVDNISLYPQEVYDDGLAVITSSVVRNHPASLSPRIKSLNYLNNIMAKVEALNAGVMEAVMLNHQGHVAECSADNIFVVRHGQGGPSLVTPPLHAGILEGVTRNVVIELAQQANIVCQQHDMTKHDLYTADEILLTGTAAEVLPVSQIDGRKIGDGGPGEVTRQLQQAFGKLVSNNAPED